MFKTFSALLILAVPSPSGIRNSRSPEYLVESWTMADGLPGTVVAGLARARDGLLWIGTHKGLARFDGTQFSVLTRANYPGLRSDYVQHMAVGPDAQMYIATWGGGLTIYDHGRARTFAKPEGLKSSMVQVVAPVGDDEAWFGTDIGFLYHYRKGSVTEVGSDVLPRDAIFGLAMGHDGTLWIGTVNGLFYLHGNTVARYRPKKPLPINGIFDLAVTDSGAVFAGTDWGVFEIQKDGWRSWTTKDGLPGDRVQVMTTAPGNVLWVGTDRGIAKLTGGRAEPVRTPFCSVLALAYDVEKSLWAGCSEGQILLRLRESPVRRLHLSGNLGWIVPVQLAEDKAGTVWMGTRHGLVQWKGNRSILYTRKDGLPTLMITDVSVAPDSSVWIGTENGFAKIRDGKLQSFRTKAPGPEDSVMSILEDHSGDLWVVAPDRLLRRRAGQATFQEIPNITGLVWSIREDSAGNVWASTRNLGLIRISGNSQSAFRTDCGLPSNMVYDSVETSRGEVWAGSEGGLSRIRDGKCASITAENGLPPGRVIAVQRDSEGHLWLKTPAVIFALDLTEANRVADFGGRLAKVRIFHDEDGFGHQFFDASPNSILRHSSGAMWFSTEGEIGRIAPSVLRVEVPSLKPRVDSLSSDAGDHDLTQPLAIRPGDMHLRLSYSAPSLVGARTHEFRYRLVGFDQGWREGGKQRDAVYTSLPPGKYKFEVIVRRPFEAWSGPSVPLEFRVLPHFYQTWWWYTLLVLASITVAALAYRLRISAVRKQYALLIAERLRERSRLARELHDTLARGMLGIHIQVEAAQVTLDVAPNSARKHLDNVERIARQALTETRTSIAELRSDPTERHTLADELREASCNFALCSNIPLTTKIADDLPWFTREITHDIICFVEEALANLRLHSAAQHAHMTVCRRKKTLFIELQDDGRGFAIGRSTKDENCRFGLIGMRERADRIGGRSEITSSLGEGTRVLLEVPIRSEWHSNLLSRFKSTLTISKLFARLTSQRMAK